MVFSFKGSFEFRECIQAWRIELADPAFGHLVDRHRIDEVQFFATVPPPGHEIGLLKNRQMLRHRLAGHVQSLAQLAERLTISAVQPIQQLPTASIGQSVKHSVVAHAGNREPVGY
jgi:hypothetical protein